MNFCKFSICIFALLFTPTLTAQDNSSRHQEGLQQNVPDSFVLKGVTLVTKPGTKIENTSLLVSDGRIIGIGDVPAPADHRVIDMTGKMIYAGLIDAYSEQEVEISGERDHVSYWNANIRPERRMSEMFRWEEDAVDSLKQNGITAVLVAPTTGIFRGQTALLLADDEQSEHAILNPSYSQAALLTTQRRRGGPRIYPSSPMGAVALARQALYDAAWYGEAWQVASQQANLNRPERNVSLEALKPVLSRQQPLMVKASNELMALRADRFAKEFNANVVIVGSGNEYRRLNEIVATNRPFVIPVNFASAPSVATPEDAMNVSLESLMHWDIAPENPSRLASAGMAFAFTSDGLDDKGEFLKRIRQAVARGLDANTALAGLTTVPARMFGVESQVGTLDVGKLANFIVTDGDLFDEKTKIVETWVAGQRHQNEEDPTRDIGGKWKLHWGGADQLNLKIKQDSDSVSGELSNLDAEPAAEAEGEKESTEGEEKSSGPEMKKLALIGTRLSGSFKSDDVGQAGTAQFSLIVDASSELAEGYIVWPDGSRQDAKATLVERTKDDEEAEGEENEEQARPRRGGRRGRAGARGGRRGRGGRGGAGSRGGRGSSRGGGGNDAANYSKEPASFPVNYPLGAYGVDQVPQAENVLFDNVTVWTCGEKGVMKNAAVLIQNGQISAVISEGQPRPTANVTIDCAGLHLTPGIIDCHSHFATDSGVNEGSQAITAEVRIGDFVDCDDITIYRQLAGGVTASNILHGSANPIGGQNQVVKLRWGMGDEAFKMKEAPAGIKFALGENVKRSRSAGSRRPDDPPPRYPTTRMGVDQLMRDTFEAAKQYKQQRVAWNTNRMGLPPRRDLELDAIVEILDGKRWIHCHSYRQDEILALIRVLDEHNITIGTFQHILEGYKVAEKMAEHGAMASAFADWWAYKFEVYDAIPYAGKIMHDAGIVVSFNSDDGELATHLNQEAAKAVKYGGVPEEEALKFVTLNPAKQLRIDQYVGSIEPGKHADLALWSGPPLSAYSRCLQTWVDGRKHFDVDVDASRRAKVAEMRQTLIQKILNSGEKMQTADSRTEDPQNMWPRYDAYCGAHINTGEDNQMMQELVEAWEAEEK